MSIESYFAKDDKQFFSLGALMADVTYDNDGGFLGDPMDKSVVDKASKLNIDRNELVLNLTAIGIIPALSLAGIAVIATV